MKDKTQKDLIKYLDGMWLKWQPILMIGGATVEFVFKDDKYMEISNRYPYLDHVIWFNNRALEDWKANDKEFENRVVHEFLHILTDPLYNKGVNRYATKDEINDERERLTDHFSIVITKLVNS